MHDTRMLVLSLTFCIDIGGRALHRVELRVARPFLSHRLFLLRLGSRAARGFGLPRPSGGVASKQLCGPLEGASESIYMFRYIYLHVYVQISVATLVQAVQSSFLVPLSWPACGISAERSKPGSLLP